MRRFLSLSLALVMGLAMLGGCASTGAKSDDNVTVRVGSLKGPTTIGIANMMSDTTEGYEYIMATQPDEIASKIGAGELDIALIPANLAATLYNKTNGGIKVIDINTLGVLYCVSADESITKIEDLAGKTVITTGQGATPEYAINYLVDQYGVADVTLDFRADGQEVIAALSQDPAQIAILPQPAATAACAQIEGVKTAFSLNDTWSALNNGSAFITGVTVVRTAFLDEHKAVVDKFISDHQASVAKIDTDLETTANRVVDLEIIAKAPLAQKAIPLCNIVCISGAQVKTDLPGYLQTLFDANPKSIGGAMPGDDFYYLG
ncbi:NitT/TauT family transport system substrate-binding protein [Ruminococcaceae bacterium YRB3002]|nr:NitT/TauT family transport system substrate-binding protein [Ruminococcaceae bacterium YRB3002]